MYMYHVFLSHVGGMFDLGWIKAKHKHMPFVPECYGIFGMRQVIVFGLSMEVLNANAETGET